MPVNLNLGGDAVLFSPEAAHHWVENGTPQAFGYVDGELYFGTNHSKITTAMLKHGWDYGTLMKMPQAWGWIRRNTAYWDIPGKAIDINFSSDDKWMINHDNPGIQDMAREAVMKWWQDGMPQQAVGARKWW